MPTTSSDPLDTVADFRTPEHIAFRFRLAGPLLRLLAYLIDAIALVIAVGLLAIPLTLIFGELGLGVLLLLAFLTNWFAAGFCEWLWKGFTPGKRACGIRVVNAEGLPAGLGACLLRNMFRAADFLPFGFLLGLVVMTVSRRFQRLGDLVAGTLVVYHERGFARQLAATRDQEILARAAELPAALETALDADSLRALTAYIERRRRFGPARRDEIADHLARPLIDAYGLNPAWTPDDVLCALYVRCFQIAEGGGAARAAAVLERRRKGWDRLEAALQGDERGGRLAQTIALSGGYRAACADLALADAYHLPEKQVRYLHDLVSRAHLAFYRQVSVSLQAMLDQVLVQVPGRLYGDPCTRIALLAFFGTFAGCALLGWLDPELVTATVGADVVADMHEMYAEPVKGRDFGAGGLMSGFYVNNNTSIALTSFVYGIFLGVGALISLIFNGIYIGLIFGFMAQTDTATSSHFFEFVSAHGPFELTGISLAGAAGLRLGLGLVVRNGLPWGDALRLSAKRSLSIAMVAGALVMLAAPIEGFISPSSMSLGGKRLVMVTCILILIVYLVGFGWRGKRELQRRARQEAELTGEVLDGP